MLTLLNLNDFVIVPALNLEAEEGLTSLTGETGAGKSILIDALQLVLGARSDTSLIREGANKTDVAAEFSMTERARKWLESQDLLRGEAILLRRTIDTSGRSRCWINGTSVTVAQMKDLGERLVDIHGQNAHQSLLKNSYQLRLLDGYGNTAEKLSQVSTAYSEWQKALTRLNEAIDDKEKLQTEAERLSWTNELLEELNPKDGEWKELSEEHALLSNAVDIVSNVQGALDNLRDADTNAARLLTLAEMQLSHAAKFDPSYAEFAKSLAQASAIVEETIRDTSRHLEHCNLDDERFSEIDDRLNAYWRLSRKFHRAPEELKALWDETKARFEEIEESADIEGLRRLETKAQKNYLDLAHELTLLRQNAAKKLSEAVTREMQALSMQGGRLEVTLPVSSPWAGGLERCEFLVSGHAGTTPRALNKIASGGELARVSLAIAVITAELTPVPTLIFDEVDTGIGGAVAEVVGRLLRKLGEKRQVLCVTHLPQVAACAHHQWQVSKQTENGVTTSNLKILTSEERVAEIARMLAGINVTDAAKAAAREMLTL